MTSKSKRTHWVSLFVDRNTAVYFDSFAIECILQEVLNKCNLMILLCVDFTIAFMEYMTAGKTLLDYTNLFSPRMTR